MASSPASSPNARPSHRRSTLEVDGAAHDNGQYGSQYATEPSSAAEADRLSILESRLQEMATLLEAERQQHKEERQALSTKLRVLEAQARAGESAPSAEQTTKRGPNMGYGERTTVLSTPRTADNLFVAVPSRSSAGTGNGNAAATNQGDVAQAQRIAAQRAAARRAGRPVTPGGGGAPSVSTASTVRRNTRGPVGGGASDTASSARNVARTPATSPDARAAPPPASLSATQRRATALQHAWDKFCATARSEFTPKELALVSAETLHSLMDHYKIRSSIERAQIEGQWALLQEGKATVGETATPKPAATARRPTVRRANHPTPFDLGGDLGKPHLSARPALHGEGIKSSNPNETTSGSALVRSHSTTVLLRPREAGQSNPNDTQCRSQTPKLCFRRAESPGPGKETPRGMRHVMPKESGEFTPRGIRSQGSTHQGGDDARAQGIRCGIDSKDGAETPRRGVRTFEQVGSPTHHRNPCVKVLSPPHLARSHLLTGTLAADQGQRWTRGVRRFDNGASRAPFALGDN